METNSKNTNDQHGKKSDETFGGATSRAEGRSTNQLNDIKSNSIGGSFAGGPVGTGGVSTNDVGQNRTQKSPLSER
jgi:hypothetical protein